MRATIAFCLAHGDAKVLITDAEFAPAIKAALAHAGPRRSSSSTSTIREGPAGERLGSVSLRGPARRRRSRVRLAGAARRVGRARAALHVGHDRRSQGRRLSPSRRLSQRARQRARVQARRRTASICGRCRCSTATAGRTRGRSPPPAARTSACAASIRRAIFAAIRDHRVTHLCGAPIVLNLLIHAPADGEAAASITPSTSRPAAPRRRRR